MKRIDSKLSFEKLKEDLLFFSGFLEQYLNQMHFHLILPIATKLSCQSFSRHNYLLKLQKFLTEKWQEVPT